MSKPMAASNSLYPSFRPAEAIGVAHGEQLPTRQIQPIRPLRAEPNAQAFIQNVRRGHYELGVEVSPNNRLPVAFTERSLVI